MLFFYTRLNHLRFNLQPFRRQRSSKLAFWLVLAGVLLRAMVPDGFMPERSASGISIAFCSASPLSKLRGDHGVPSSELGHTQCVFAAAAGPALLAADIRSAHFGGSPGDLARFVPIAFFSRFSSGRPPARGPPAFS